MSEAADPDEIRYGEPVDFGEYYKTYEIGPADRVAYIDENGDLRLIDNTLVSASRETEPEDVKMSDILTGLAEFYGVSKEQIIEDNQLVTGVMREGDILFIRNPLRNAETEYTADAPIADEDAIRYLLISIWNASSLLPEKYLRSNAIPTAK